MSRKEQIDSALAAKSLRQASIDAGEPGWYETVLVDGEPTPVWVTDSFDEFSDYPRHLYERKMENRPTDILPEGWTATDALIAVVGASAALAGGAPERVAGLEDAKALAILAGATESEIDDAVVRGQQNVPSADRADRICNLAQISRRVPVSERIGTTWGAEASATASGPNPLLRNRDAVRLKDSSIKTAEGAASACTIGQSRAAGRAEQSKRRTAIQDLKDHWSRALKAKTASDALAELAHASMAAREAHGSDEYERRAIEIVKLGQR